MLKAKLKIKQTIAGILTLVFLSLAIYILADRTQDSNQSTYLAIKPDGKIIKLSEINHKK